LPTASDRRPIICYVTDSKALNARDTGAKILSQIRQALLAGADWVQVREKFLTTHELLDLVRKAVEAAIECGSARIVVNDRIDVALAGGAHGVHLGHTSIPTREAGRWYRSGNAPDDFLVGVSCHSLEEALQAQQDGARYLFFGPIFETPSKLPFGQPQGLEKLGEVCRGVETPVIAIGGVNDKNAIECIRAGAAGIAAIRLFQEAAEGAVANAIRSIRNGAKRNEGTSTKS
jgi:thiamine-phosphate pyrophosphorylase